MILGIDPGAYVGIAMFDEKKMVCKTSFTKEFSTNEPQIKYAVQCIATYAPSIVAVEGQFQGPNPWSTEKVTESRCAWQNAAQLADIPVVVVLPRVWQARFGVNKKKIEPKVKRRMLQNEVLSFCKTIPHTDHEIAAVLIAHHVALKEKV
jgi:Holliday junction resolvasome RuvABC endonuclease subunit